MYFVVRSCLRGERHADGEPILASRVTSVLRDFMEKSNVAEYPVRLEIVYVYHCHLVHLEPTPMRGKDSSSGQCYSLFEG